MGAKKGHTVSEEIKLKISNTMKKKKIGFQKGYKPWNTGLTKETDNRVAKNAINVSKALMGHVGYWKGKKKPQSEETKQKISKSLIGNKNCEGRQVSEETRQKLSKSKRGENNPNYGKPLSIETKEKISAALSGRSVSDEFREKMREIRLRIIIPKKDTSIEVALQKELKRRGVRFKTHVPLFGQPDIFIEPDICVFMDGNYWHNYPCGTERDREVNRVLTEEGYGVLRFWGSEIRENTERCVKAIMTEG